MTNDDEEGLTPPGGRRLPGNPLLATLERERSIANTALALAASIAQLLEAAETFGKAMRQLADQTHAFARVVEDFSKQQHAERKG